jgi:erythromycin esterase
LSVPFIEWARVSLAPLATVKPGQPWDDLKFFGERISDATVVALSEGAHAAAEPLEFRNRLFQYLVREKGFTAIAIESGLIESRFIHEYVRGGSGELNTLVTQGVGSGMGELPQNRDLVRWMREYNADATHARKINFYGFDLSGLLSSGHPYFGHDLQVGEALRFLSRVDGDAAEVFRGRFEPFLPSMRFHPQRALEGPCYTRLSGPERDSLTATISDLVIWIERREGKYTAASTAQDYVWGHCAALAARQMDSYLRQYPPGWMLSGPQTAADGAGPAINFDAANVRSRTQADNVDWIVRNEGPGGKVLLFAARTHLSAAAVKVRRHPHREEYERQAAGTYLRRRYGARLLTIGNLIGQGEWGCGEYRYTLPKASVQSLDGLAGELGVPLFLLDLRQAPADVKRWLNQEQELVSSTQRLKLPVAQAFDVLFYTDTVRRADADV